MKASRRATSPAPGKAGRPLRNRDGLRAEILAWLARQTAPVRISELFPQLRAKKVTVRTLVRALVDEGQVVYSGKSAAVRIGLPAVMAAAKAAAEAHAAEEAELRDEKDLAREQRREAKRTKKAAVELRRQARKDMAVRLATPPVDSRPVDTQLRDGVHGVLATGASYDMRELVRKIRPKCPHVEAAVLEPVLEAMRVEGEIQRIPVGESFRWRRCAIRAPKAASA